MNKYQQAPSTAYVGIKVIADPNALLVEFELWYPNQKAILPATKTVAKRGMIFISDSCRNVVSASWATTLDNSCSAVFDTYLILTLSLQIEKQKSHLIKLLIKMQ